MALILLEFGDTLRRASGMPGYENKTVLAVHVLLAMYHTPINMAATSMLPVQYLHPSDNHKTELENGNVCSW